MINENPLSALVIILTLVSVSLVSAYITERKRHRELKKRLRREQFERDLLALCEEYHREKINEMIQYGQAGDKLDYFIKNGML